MSFTVAVKEEILGQHHLSRHELSAIIKMSGSIGLSTSGLTLSVVTENAKLARHLYESFLHFFMRLSLRFDTIREAIFVRIVSIRSIQMRGCRSF